MKLRVEALTGLSCSAGRIYRSAAAGVSRFDDAGETWIDVCGALARPGFTLRHVEASLANPNYVGVLRSEDDGWE